MSTKFLLSSASITIINDGVSTNHPFPSSKFSEIAKLAGQGKFSKITELIEKGKLKKKSKIIETFEIKKEEDGSITLGGEVIDFPVKGLLEFLKIQEDKKIPIDHVINFIKLLKQNPDDKSKTNAFEFIKNNGMLITEHGYVVGCRAVRSDYLDKHSRTIMNKPHTFVSMDRELCDSNPHADCSRGLHVGTKYYFNGFVSSCDIAQIVLVHPKDIVSVPHYDKSKMRTCKYYIYKDTNVEEMKMFEADNIVSNINIKIDFDNEQIFNDTQDDIVTNIESSKRKLDKKTIKKVAKRLIKENKPTKDIQRVLSETTFDYITETKSGGRISITSKSIKAIGLCHGDKVDVSIIGKKFIIRKHFKKNFADFTYVVDKDNMIRLGAGVLKKISSKTKWKVSVDGNVIEVTVCK